MAWCDAGRSLRVRFWTAARRAPVYIGGMVHAAPSPSWLRRAREVVTDLLIATALIWALPLLLAAASGLLAMFTR